MIYDAFFTTFFYIGRVNDQRYEVRHSISWMEGGTAVQLPASFVTRVDRIQEQNPHLSLEDAQEIAAHLAVIHSSQEVPW